MKYDLTFIIKKICNDDECDYIIKKLITLNHYDKYVDSYFLDKITFINEIKNNNEWRQWFLGFFSYMLLETYNKFIEKYEKTQEKIFFETAKDIYTWAKDCKRKYGYWGIDEVKWVSNIIDLNLFRIGRLEFRIHYLSKDYEVNNRLISSNTKLISIHIPSGGKLVLSECLKAIEEAYLFFDKKYSIMFCNSWLLDEKLSLFLNDDSNIIKFQKLFTIVDKKDDDSCERFVFGECIEDKNKYIENTSLQRKLKKYLLEGGKIGSSLGLLFLDNFGKILTKF